MTTRDARLLVSDSIGNAMAELSHALAELERMPDDETLVGFVAHAMDNYLTVSDAALALMERALGGHTNPEVAVWLDGLRHLGTLMRHTVERLLRSSEPDSAPLKPGYVNLPLLMQRACDYHRSAAAKKELGLVCRALGDVPPVWADRVAVAIVATNLLSNAVKFSQPHGDIVVQVMAGPGGVVCSVRDHGPGLTFMEHARLFEQAETPVAAPADGDPSLGHGLAIAKDLVDRMGGRLWAENQPGHGACFFFRLPYQPGPVLVTGATCGGQDPA